MYWKHEFGCCGGGLMAADPDPVSLSLSLLSLSLNPFLFPSGILFFSGF